MQFESSSVRAWYPLPNLSGSQVSARMTILRVLLDEPVQVLIDAFPSRYEGAPLARRTDKVVSVSVPVGYIGGLTGSSPAAALRLPGWSLLSDGLCFYLPAAGP